MKKDGTGMNTRSVGDRAQRAKENSGNEFRRIGSSPEE